MKKQIKNNNSEDNCPPPLCFEETIKRLLELPPKKQSEIKSEKKDK
jgi:hypothetical protein